MTVCGLVQPPRAMSCQRVNPCPFFWGFCFFLASAKSRLSVRLSVVSAIASRFRWFCPCQEPADRIESKQ